MPVLGLKLSGIHPSDVTALDQLRFQLKFLGVERVALGGLSDVLGQPEASAAGGWQPPDPGSAAEAMPPPLWPQLLRLKAQNCQLRAIDPSIGFASNIRCLEVPNNDIQVIENLQVKRAGQTYDQMHCCPTLPPCRCPPCPRHPARYAPHDRE